jgi:protein-S-isoprenylcysteine O-methyltransferase Ste14
MSSLVILYYAAIVYWVGVESWIWLREIGKILTGKDRNTRLIIVGCIVIAVYLATTLIKNTTFSIWGSSDVHYVLGALVIIAGVSFRLWSVLTLGKFFRTTVMVQNKHKVITHGPYKYIRHPSYSGALVATVGVGLGTGNWLALLAMLLCIFVGLRYRISVEEKVLQKELGKDYQDYMQRTKKLIPFLY